jgi:Ni2+-binding GTPase involved in maturation of urease and hydrogenase
MKLFLIGGFLGSGKTTAIHRACSSFLKHARKVAVITNDQGTDLVDTEFIKTAGVKAEEVINGCFCCNYNQFAEAIQSLEEKEKPDIIFAESVGSCTDLVAAIARPLAKFSPGVTVVISVFADAQLLYSLITGNASFMDEHVRYLYKKQLEEADILVINKVDLVHDVELKKVKEQIEADFPGKTVLYQNSLDENSVRSWVLSLMRFELSTDRITLDLDYDLYARGEAILGWLDQRIVITTKDNSASSVARELMLKIYADIKKAGYPIAHLKFLCDDGTKKSKISYTAMDGISKEVFLVDNRTNKISVLLNARIQVDASILEEIVSEAISQIAQQTGCKIEVDKKVAFQPAYPRPVHRMG